MYDYYINGVKVTEYEWNNDDWSVMKYRCLVKKGDKQWEDS